MPNYGNDLNRLIILGNGFDLAHGLPTTYSDFMFDYLQKELNYQTVKENLISINIHRQIAQYKRNLTSLLEVFNPPDYSTISEFITDLIKSAKNGRWVDIENFYYKYLIDGIIKNRSDNTETLNEDFEKIKKLLEDYLISIQDKNTFQYIENLNSIFNQKIQQKDFKKPEFIDDHIPSNTLFLNFNYTNTIKQYTDKFKHDCQLINIHGQLEDKNNPIIFGFGDELDTNYKIIEDKNDNKLFEHMKSFKYMETSNYHDLIRFVDSKPFQVFIIGHSCGLSDRTMLNHIFESNNCCSIKIFYHNSKSDFITKTQDISRHFTNKSDMRNKIVPLDKSEKCPQLKSEI